MNSLDQVLQLEQRVMLSLTIDMDKLGDVSGQDSQIVCSINAASSLYTNLMHCNINGKQYHVKTYH